MADLTETLSALRGAWMAGRSGASLCPDDWREAADGSEAALAALAGQAMQVLMRPRPPDGLTRRTPLPGLATPLAPEAQRPAIRRLLAGRKSEAGGVQALVRFLASRGYALHPADWMPAVSDRWAGDLYGPWLDWIGAGPRSGGSPNDVLTLETWEDWTPAAALTALAALRRRDPTAARTIIAAKAAAEPADRRLRLVEILAEQLQPEDAPLLESLASDRADRVRTLVRRLLARIGHGGADPALAAELAAMLEASRTGLLRRRTQVRLGRLKTPAQEARRRELFDLVVFADLAKALGLDEAALVEATPEGEPAAVRAFIACAAGSASDAIVGALATTLLDDAEVPAAWLAPLGPRLAPAARAAALPTVMAREASPSCQDALAFAGDALGGVPAAALERAGVLKTLATRLAAAEAEERDGARQVGLWLASVALLIDAEAAGRLLTAATTAGIGAADPRLDWLRLNAALPTAPPSSPGAITP